MNRIVACVKPSFLILLLMINTNAISAPHIPNTTNGCSSIADINDTDLATE